jgi:hypothetical protein
VSITLDSTISGELTNSYVDQSYSDAYWLQHWDTVSAGKWQALSDTQKAFVLVGACRIIDTLRFTEQVDPLQEYHLVYDSRNQQIRSVKTNYGRPQKYNYVQHLQFPRTLDVHLDGTIFIPEEIMMAQCEQAVYMMGLDTSVIGNRLQGVSHDSINVGGVAISQKLEANGSMMSPVALQYCKPYLIKTSQRLYRS